MPLGGVYDTGTVAVTNGSATVVGTGVFWPDVLEGDHLIIGGLVSLILSVNTGTSTITLMKPYAGASNATATYQIAKMSWLRYDPSTVMYQVRAFLSKISDSNTALIYYTTGTPDAAIGENGDIAIDTTVTPVVVWRKVAGIWTLLPAGLGGGSSGGREKLTANRTYLVNPSSGNDANDGILLPVATVQKADALANALDFNGFAVRIELAAAGTYPGDLNLTRKVGQRAVDDYTITGSTATRSAYVMTGAIGMSDAYAMVKDLTVKGFSLDDGSILHYKNITLSVFASWHHFTIDGWSQVRCDGNYEYTGSNNSCHIVVRRGKFSCSLPVTATATGTPGFIDEFVFAGEHGTLELNRVTWAGAVTGPRFYLNPGAFMNADNVSVTGLPGNSLGIIQPGAIAKFTSGYAAGNDAIKCWGRVTVTGAVPTLQLGYNLTSIADTATGRLTVNIGTDFSNVNYQIGANVERAATAMAVANLRYVGIRQGTIALGSFELECWDGTAGTALLADPQSWHFSALGPQTLPL